MPDRKRYLPIRAGSDRLPRGSVQSRLGGYPLPSTGAAPGSQPSSTGPLMRDELPGDESRDESPSEQGAGAHRAPKTPAKLAWLQPVGAVVLLLVVASTIVLPKLSTASHGTPTAGSLPPQVQTPSSEPPAPQTSHP